VESRGRRPSGISRKASRVDVSGAERSRHSEISLRTVPATPSPALERGQSLLPGRRIAIGHPMPAVHARQSRIPGEVERIHSTSRYKRNGYVMDEWYRTPEDRALDVQMVNAIREMLGMDKLYGANKTGRESTQEEQHAALEFSFSHGYEGNLRRGKGI
jgi:hypothetical protein